MNDLYRERLLRIRDEDELPHALIYKVERAEHELRMLGGGTLAMRDLVLLSAMVETFDEALDRGDDALMALKDAAIDSLRRGECEPGGLDGRKLLAAGDLVNVNYNGETVSGKVVSSWGEKKRKVELDHEQGLVRIFEVGSLEAI